jgi:hypothetical protein
MRADRVSVDGSMGIAISPEPTSGLQGGKPMTVDECHAALVAIRRRQGTRCPLIRVDCGGAAYRGRLVRADSDPEHRATSSSPFGILVLGALGLTRGPETVLQIASIPEGGIRELEEASSAA